MAAWSGAREPRVAASLVLLGYSARLLGPVLAVWVRDGLLVDVRPGEVLHRFAPDTGLRLALRHATGRPAPVPDGAGTLHDEVLAGHLAPVVAAVRSAAPVAAGLLWGNVASSLAGSLAAIARAGLATPQRCHEAGQAVLRTPLLRGTGVLTLAASDRLTFTRRSCCLYYRLDGGGLCGDCPLVRS